MFVITENIMKRPVVFGIKSIRLLVLPIDVHFISGDAEKHVFEFCLERFQVAHD
jgi:hypothetical protein